MPPPSAEAAAEAAAVRAGVTVRAVESSADLRAVSDLLASVWGRNAEGVPIPSEVMRSLAHAGGCTTAAFSADGTLVAAACLAVAAPAGSTYSLIAAAARGRVDRGTGYAVKLHQRAWALARGFTSMRWTFDPLVSRNARFNLTKLGASADDYVVDFYGEMTDDLNAGDESDRLVVTWALDSRRADRAAAGRAEGPEAPASCAHAEADGPDGAPMLLTDGDERWLRVPREVMVLRRDDPGLAAAWRHAARDAFTDALAEGLVAVGMTRDGWYRLAPTAEKHA